MRWIDEDDPADVVCPFSAVFSMHSQNEKDI